MKLHMASMGLRMALDATGARTGCIWHPSRLENHGFNCPRFLVSTWGTGMDLPWIPRLNCNWWQEVGVLASKAKPWIAMGLYAICKHYVEPEFQPFPLPFNSSNKLCATCSDVFNERWDCGGNTVNHHRLMACSV